MTQHFSFFNLHDTILVLTAMESFLLCLLLSVVPSENKQARLMLFLFFLSTGCIISSTFVIWNSYLQNEDVVAGTLFTSVLAASTLLQGPALYFYFLSLSEKINLLTWRNGLHLIPAMITVAIIVLFKVDTQAWLPWNRAQLNPDTLLAVTFSWAILRCLPMCYVLACVFLEYRLRRQAGGVANGGRLENNLLMANIVLGGFLFIEIWSVAGYLLGDFISGEANNWMGMAGDYLSTLLVNAMFIYGIRNTRQLMIEQMPVEQKKESPMVYTDAIFAIEKAVREQKIYLERNLNAARFAERVGLRQSELADILKKHYQLSFSDFINAHRMKEALSLLSSDQRKGEKIQDIMFKSGFNSESTFNRCFKNTTGVTPSEYRLMHQIKSRKKSKGSHKDASIAD